jgi:acetyl-CoA/propionyl-CoA carboxylase biotin carboxyl carrier protein
VTVLRSVLVANRGEIAVRIIRTLRRLGISSVAVYSEADAGALHVTMADQAVLIGPRSLAQSYLSVERIIGAALLCEASAIHPGYGFLSEAPELAAACEAAGIIFVGPRSETIELMGDKIRAKQTVGAAGIPTVPGRTEPGLSDEDLVRAVEEIGLPTLLKPSAGGGGKGMRLLEGDAQIDAEIASARREAISAFGDGTLFVERYLPSARHIEVQILADAHGNVVHLGERECSLQRRHQKIVEEAPSPFLDDTQRSRLGSLAVDVARISGYRNAGTIEFIVNAADPAEAYFMEMNSRLQVEHPVTEEVWGVDLVEHQLRVAAGETLSLAQDELRPSGHAIEARIYAEDPSSGFLPTGGRIVRLREPAADLARVESGLLEGLEVGSSFDPMLSKIIAFGPDRPAALRRLDAALRSNEILGVGTNTGFLRALLQADEVVAGTLDTGLVERLAPQIDPCRPDTADLAAAAILDLLASSRADGVWDLSGWRIGGSARSVFTARSAGQPIIVELQATEDGFTASVGDATLVVRAVLDEGDATVEVDGVSRRYGVASAPEGLWVGRDGMAWLFSPELAAEGDALGSAADHVSSPMPGTVTAVDVEAGAQVAEGQVLVVVEAMKMEHALRSPRDGVVATVHVAVGDQVRLGQFLAELEGA